MNAVRSTRSCLALLCSAIVMATLSGPVVGLASAGEETIIDPAFDPPRAPAAVMERDATRESVPFDGRYEKLERSLAGKAASPLWSTDVLMTPGDSLVRNALLDFDATDGSFYSFIWHTGTGGHEGVKLFRSTNGGLTWQSRGSVYYSGMAFADADFVYCDSLAICVMAGTLNGQHRLWCAIRGMPNGLWSFPSPFFTSATDSIRSIALATDCDDYPSAPYIYLVADIAGDIHFWRSTDRAQTWTQHAVLETDGPWLFPDIAYSWDSGGDLYVTYYKSPNVVVARSRSFGMAGSWVLNWQQWAIHPGAMPVVAALRDSVQVIFNRRDEETDDCYISLRASITAGSTWYGARLSWAPGEEMLPDITARGGVFRASWMLTALPHVNQVYYARCLSAASFDWEMPYPVINDHVFYWEETPFGNPCVEYLPGVGAGVVYTGNFENRRAWVDFVGAPWVGAEPPRARPAGVLLAPVENPIRGEARLAVNLSRDANLRLEIFDLSGRLVATLHDGPLAAGERAFAWNPGDRAAGVYFVRLRAEGRSEMQKLILLR